MIGALVRKEVRLAVRSRRVQYAAAGMTALAFIALASGFVEYTARLEAHRALMLYSDASFKTQKAAHPHQIAHNGYVVSRPPAPLGFLDGGVETAYGTHVRLDAHRTRPLQGARVAELARGPGGGRFDLALLLAVFAPALVFLLSYDQIAGERTRGTFDMLRVAGVRAWPFVLAKLIGLSVRVILAIALPALAAVAAAVLIAGRGVPMGRLFAWLLLHALALSTWMLVALLCSALAQSARGALLSGFAVWGVLALAVPPLAGGLAVALRPLPPLGEEMVRAEKWAASAHAQNDALKTRALADIKRRHPEWNGLGDPPEIVDAVMLRLADADVAKNVSALLDRLEREEDAEQRIAAVASIVSPAGLASLASSAIAGSDISHMRATWRHYEEYRVVLMAWFNDWWAKNGKGGFDAFSTDRTFADFDRAPKLVQPTFGLRFALKEAALPAALLLGASCLAFAALLWLVGLRLKGRTAAARPAGVAEALT